MSMPKQVLEIVSKEQLKELRDNGWVVIHREPTDAMGKAFIGGKWPEQVSFDQGFHRMVATSIRQQNGEG